MSPWKLGQCPYEPTPPCVNMLARAKTSFHWPHSWLEWCGCLVLGINSALCNPFQDSATTILALLAMLRTDTDRDNSIVTWPWGTLLSSLLLLLPSFSSFIFPLVGKPLFQLLYENHMRWINTRVAKILSNIHEMVQLLYGVCFAINKQKTGVPAI